MQSGREDTLEERYAIQFCFKLGENATETYGMLQTAFGASCMNRAHRFLSGIRDSRKLGSLWAMLRGVGGVRKSEHQSWLCKGLGLRLLCWVFKGVQEEIPSEEASTRHIESVAFPPGQYTSPQLHPYHRLFEQDRHQYSSLTPSSPDVALCDFWLFLKLGGCRYETIEEMKEAVKKVIDTFTQENFYGAFQKLFERYNKCIAVGGDYFEGY